MITRNKVVTLTYELHRDTENGSMIEAVNAEHPFVFLYGSGGLLPEFEANLAGKNTGDTFAFSIKAENAYGKQDDEAMEYVPKEIFMLKGQLAEDLLQIDNYVNLRDHEGRLVRAKVVEVGEAEVLLDFNHPLAGQNLFFKGNILDVRDATENELEHGHVHGEGDNHHA